MRQVLRTIRPTRDAHPHRGLLFDTRLTSQDAKKELMALVSEHRAPAIYADFYRRWEQAMHHVGETSLYQAKLQTNSPILVGMGAKSVSEVGLTLHRTYGTPYLPGSSLKGLAASFARNRLDPGQWGPDSAAYRILFGDTDEAGYVVFHDAQMVPGSARSGDLQVDTVTVHHKAYYEGKNKPPADWDSPVPVPMLVCTCDFTVALSGPAEWRKAAADILRHALAEEGIGSKTSSGYGRLQLSKASLDAETMRAQLSQGGRS